MAITVSPIIRSSDCPILISGNGSPASILRTARSDRGSEPSIRAWYSFLSEVITFTGTGSDPDGSIALYEWDFDGDGYERAACGGTDCDDTDPAVNPGQAEVPGNGIDDDCDGQVDEGCFIGSLM